MSSTVARIPASDQYFPASAVAAGSPVQDPAKNRETLGELLNTKLP